MWRTGADHGMPRTAQRIDDSILSGTLTLMDPPIKDPHTLKVPYLQGLLR